MASRGGGGGCGSSPHTRGLLRVEPSGDLRRGIIPAHAGFTVSRNPSSHGDPDHPRTRGVYAAACASVRTAGGSSPHTRGLPMTGIPPSMMGGIIPAHAGFTAPCTGPCSPSRDHPRTRGVYSPACGCTPRGCGSSPHTRGLLGAVACEGGVSGIIPAHAGFTRRGPRSSSRRRDHPRTRGVYPVGGGQRGGGGGSSPHTRGLRRRGHRDPRRPRDHPRTRGVYGGPGEDLVGALGSSPHTRGLRLAILGIPTVLESTTPRFPSLLT